MDEKIFQLFSFLSKLEQATNARRKVLNNYYEYNPTKIFKIFDYEGKNYITPENIALFLNNHDIPFTDESLKLLFIFYDTDFDGVLSFQEFISLIQNDNILLNNKKINLNNDELSFNIDYCLTKIFEKEIELNQYIINIITQINKNIDDNLLDIFNEISLNKKYIKREDIMNYLDNNKIDYTENQINDIMKRLDINKDGKIDFNEFDYLFGLTNPKNFKKYNLNFRVQPMNNYINNNNDYQNILNDFSNNENYNINNCNKQFDMKNNINQNKSLMENKLYQTPLLTQNNGYCIHCIDLPCCICHYDCNDNQVKSNNFSSNLSNNNLIDNNDNNKYNYINNKMYNEELNNNINNNFESKNEYENKEKDNIFLNSLINENLYNNDIYYQKNYKYENPSNIEYNNYINKDDDNFIYNQTYKNNLKKIFSKTIFPH